MQQNVDLRQLNGANGFTIQGKPYSKLGYSVSTAGDINGDGLSDIVLGAPSENGSSGAVYVIFGHRGIFLSGFNLSTLNGINGFSISAIISGSSLGDSVSTAGDINGDGLDDFVIGAPGSGAGAYVIFGSRTNFTASFDLNSLNGTNGFRIAKSGFPSSVASAGDVNGDGLDDLVFGQDGTAYLVYGNRNGFSSIFNISVLNGTNGFTIFGTGAGYLGRSVSSAGDINGDGLNDIVLGAFGADLNTITNSGAAYVIFGNRSGFDMNFNLATLNGANGFVIPGIVPNQALGSSVSTAGDINGDGISDIVLGAPTIGVSSSASYVIFGSRGTFPASFNLTTLNASNGFMVPEPAGISRLGFSVGTAGDLNSDGLSELILSSPSINYVVFGSRDGFSTIFNLTVLNSTTGFTIPWIFSRSYQGTAASCAGDINGDGLTDLILGHPDINTNSGAGYVIFRNPLTWVNNQMTIIQGKSLLLNFTNLNATDLSNATATLAFTLSSIRGGHFELVTNPGVPILNFTNQQIATNQVGFASDRTDVVSYQVSATNGRFNLTPQPAKVTFINNVPIVAVSPGTQFVYPNQSFYFIFLANSTFIDPDEDPLTYSVSLSDGSALPNWLKFDSSQSNQLAFNGTSPTLASMQIRLLARDPINATVNTTFTLLTTSIWINNQMTITQGQMIPLNSTHFDATGLNDPLTSLVFTASNVRGGRFELIANPGKAISSFTQQQVNNGIMRFVSDRTAPVSYEVALNNSKFSLPPQPANVTFINNAPIVKSAPTTQIIKVNEAFLFTLDPEQIFSDPDNDSLTYFAQSKTGDALPSWLQFSENTNNQLTFSGIDPVLGGTRINLFARDVLNASVSTEFELLAVPPTSINSNATGLNVFNTSTSQIAGGVVGGLLGLGALVGASFGFWRYATDKSSRQGEHFANYIRDALNLKNVNNFTTNETGQQYVTFVHGLTQGLKGVGIDTQGMRAGELRELANDVAAAARNKITPATDCWGNSVITVDDLNNKTQEMVTEIQVLRSGVPQEKNYTM